MAELGTEESVQLATVESRSTWQLIRSPWTLLILAVGILIRLWIINSNRGALIADESYTVLQAADMLHGHIPLLIPTVAYTATFDSMVYAPFTAVVGQNVVAMKLFPSIAWGLAAFLAVAIVRRFGSDRAAVLAGAFVWLAPGALAVIATRAYLGYASGMATMLGAILAAVLVFESGRPDRGGAPDRWRSALAGALAGFALFLHPMYIAVLLPAMAVPTWRFRKMMRAWWMPAVAAAIAVNIPYIIWNARHEWASLSQPAEASEGPVPRFVRFGTGLAPRAYGVRAEDGSYIFGRPLAVLAMAVLALVAAYGALTLWRRKRWLAGVIVGPLILGWVIMAGFTNTTYVTDGRYAIATFPFVAIAAAMGLDALLPKWRLATYPVVALWLAVFSVPFLVHETGTRLHDPNAQFRQVATLLESKGIHRLSGFYWWVLPIEVVSDHRVLVSVAGHPFTVTRPYTQRLVDNSPPETVAFLFWAGDDNVQKLRLPIDRYDRIVLADFVLYTPKP
jgi:4-amino-4-deoxy-L-arabinose transferase-like glycosyltransferase